VRGASLLSNTKTDNFTGDGVKTSFPLSFMPSAQSGAPTVTVTVGGVAQTVAFDNGRAATTQFVITVGSLGTVTQAAIGTAALTNGTAAAVSAGVAIVVTYSYDVPIVLTMQNPASITRYNTSSS